MMKTFFFFLIEIIIITIELIFAYDSFNIILLSNLIAIFILLVLWLFLLPRLNFIWIFFFVFLTTIYQIVGIFLAFLEVLHICLFLKGHISSYLFCHLNSLKFFLFNLLSLFIVSYDFIQQMLPLDIHFVLHFFNVFFFVNIFQE